MGLAPRHSLTRLTQIASLAWFVCASGAAAQSRSTTRAAAAYKSTAEVARSTMPATVTILALGEAGDTLTQGSGFVVRSDGVIVTNWHVLHGASRALVVLADHERFSRVSVLDADSAIDIALLKVPGYGLPTVPVRASIPSVGEKVIAIGSPFGLSQTVSEGIVSASRIRNGRELVQITAPISPGSSGGPLLDATGRAFAITTLYLVGGQQLNFAVPVRYAMGLLSDASSPRSISQVFGSASSSSGSGDEHAAEVSTRSAGHGTNTYVGTVINGGLPNSPASLSIEFDLVADTAWGNIDIGTPLGGSGRFMGIARRDSVFLVSGSQSGDTIAWRGGWIGDSVVGTYRIVGGRWIGEQGSWTVRRARGVPWRPSVAAATDSRPVRASRPRSSLAGTYVGLQTWDPGLNQMTRQYALIIASSTGGWLDVSWIRSDSLVGKESVFWIDSFRTNPAGDIALDAGGVTYDGFQTDSGGVYVSGIVSGAANASPQSVRLHAEPYSIRLSETYGYYTAHIRTSQYQGNEYRGVVDWTGDAAVDVANDSIYIVLNLTNEAGGTTGMSVVGPVSKEGAFKLTDGKGADTRSLVGHVHAGVLSANWIDSRPDGVRFVGALEAQRQ